MAFSNSYNPLDVSQVVPPLVDPEASWSLPVQGIPGLISGDAITQSYVALMQDQVKRANDFALGIYNDLLSKWHGANARGTYNPAPGPVILAGVNPKAAAIALNTGKGFPSIIYYTQYYDATAPPGTIFTAPTPPLPPPKNWSVGKRVVGTNNLYYAEGGPYSESDVGEELTVGSDKFQLILGSPMGASYFFLKEA